MTFVILPVQVLDFRHYLVNDLLVWLWTVKLAADFNEHAWSWRQGRYTFQLRIVQFNYQCMPAAAFVKRKTLGAARIHGQSAATVNSVIFGKFTGLMDMAQGQIIKSAIPNHLWRQGVVHPFRSCAGQQFTMNQSYFIRQSWVRLLITFHKIKAIIYQDPFFSSDIRQERHLLI